MSSSAQPDRTRSPARASRWKNRLACLLACLAVVGLYLSGGLEFAERRLDEAKFGLLERPASGDVVLVEIDARSLAELGVWPWPRRLHASIIERLLDAGARRVVFDVDFSTYSNGEDDAQFRSALIASNGKVVLPVFRQKASNAAAESDLVDSLPAPIFRPYADLAVLNVFASDDGRVRQQFVSGTVAGGSYPTLAVFLAGPDRVSHSSFAIDFGIDPATVPFLSYTDVLSGNFQPEDVAGKQVVIGSTAAELGDFLAVPHRITIPGPLLHILGYESIVQGRALQRLAEVPIVILVVILVLCLGWISERLSLAQALGIATAAVVFVAAPTVLVQARFPVQIDTAPLLLAVLLTVAAAMANRLNQQSIRLLFQGFAIRRKDVMLHNLVEKSIVGVAICAEDGRIELINRAAADMFGHGIQDLAGAAIGLLVPELAPRGDGDILPLRKLSEAGRQELSGHRLGGGQFPVEITANEDEIDGRPIFVAFMNDITIRRYQEDELHFRADHDWLTELPNRTTFSKLLETALSESAEAGPMVAVYLLDLDRFKNVNDTLGHAVGDRLLQDVAKRLSGQMTDGAILSRFGGDEFAICLPFVVDIGKVEEFAGKILVAMKQPFDVDQLSLEVGGSIGYALYPDDGASADLLLQRADIAMYSAKRFQSGFSKYWAEDDANSVRNLTLTGDLRRAIDEGELELAFQPKICLALDAVIGVEVLCRWNRPGHGFVSPDEFIEHAEQSGLIYPLTRWVLHKSVETAAIWRELGWDLNVAVNLSARLLHHEQVLSLVTDALDRWDYPAEKLTLEITENALLADPAHAMIVISELSALGLKVSIDDFGTGYSSLSYLTTLAANEVKIDKSFVLGMETDKKFEAIVRSVVALAHDLNLQVVAEGIENEDCLATLCEIGCDVGQGYLFGKPMPVADFENWLKSCKWAKRPRVAESTAQLA